MKLFWKPAFIVALAGRSSCSANEISPRSFGYVILPGFDLLDVAGPLEALFFLSLQTSMTLSLITPSLLDLPPTNWPALPTMNPFNSSFGIGVIPAYNFSTAPALDVLLLHGGSATRAPNLNSTFTFVRDRYPSLQYLIAVCTGAGVAARAGVLDGKRATTNKRAWAQTTALGPKVKWVSHARWVVDGKIWTSSGVSASIDAVLAWIGSLYGDDVALGIANMMEYERHTNSSWDPFADLYNLADTTS